MSLLDDLKQNLPPSILNTPGKINIPTGSLNAPFIEGDAFPIKMPVDGIAEGDGKVYLFTDLPIQEESRE